MWNAWEILTAFLLADAVAFAVMWVFSPSFREWVQSLFYGDWRD